MTGFHPPKDIGSAVAEGFTLPWNTTRTMADVWADEVSRAIAERRKRDEARARATPRKRRVNEYLKIGLTKRGKIPFAGYEANEVT